MVKKIVYSGELKEGILSITENHNYGINMRDATGPVTPSLEGLGWRNDF